MSVPKHEYHALTRHGVTFAACVYEPDRSGERASYPWLVWGPRAFQREGESTTRLGAWERIEAAAHYGASVVARRA